MQPTFHVAQWYATSTRLITPEHWQAWAHHTLSPNSLPMCVPELSFLPALQRRRLSLAARLMFQAAYQVMGNESCPTIFVSHDGELNRSFQLWQTLLREHDVSPTSFGLSVHNAVVGQWSIWRHDTHEHTALAAQNDGWEYAFLEAAGLLAEGHSRVLVVAVEDPLSDEIALNHVARAPFAYAVAARLEAAPTGQTWTLTPHTPPHSSHTPNYWGALHWVKQMYLRHSAFFNLHNTWQWHTTL